MGARVPLAAAAGEIGAAPEPAMRSAPQHHRLATELTGRRPHFRVIDEEGSPEPNVQQVIVRIILRHGLIGCQRDHGV